MAKQVSIDPKVVRNNLSNLKRLDVPTLLDLLEEKSFQGKEVTPDPEFAKLVQHVLSKREKRDSD